MIVVVGTSSLTLQIKDFIDQKKDSKEMVDYQRAFGCPKIERQIGIYEEYRLINIGNYFSIDLPIFLKESDSAIVKDSDAILSKTFEFNGDTANSANYNYVSISVYPISANHKIRAMYQGKFIVNPDKASMTLERTLEDLSEEKIKNGEKYLDFLSNYEDPENVSTYVINEGDAGHAFTTYVVVNKLKDIVIVISVGEGPCFEKGTRYDYSVSGIKFL